MRTALHFMPAQFRDLATLEQRLIGQIVDGLIAVVAIIAGIVAGGLISRGVAISPWAPLVGTIAAVSGYVVGALYLLLADGLPGGQSLGKRLVKTAVIDAASGNPCTFARSLLRNIFGVLGLIDLVFVFGKRRQRLGDIVANTIVLKRGVP